MRERGGMPFNLFLCSVMAKKEDKGNEFSNPIDPDKITERPDILPYGHTVGAPPVKPMDKGKAKSRALSAMQEQTDLQLRQIKEQIDLLAKQAKAISDRVNVSHKIYDAEMGFEPLISHTYHLYKKEDGGHKLLMLAPHEWDCTKKKLQFVATIKMLADHTWEILS